MHLVFFSLLRTGGTGHSPSSRGSETTPKFRRMPPPLLFRRRRSDGFGGRGSGSGRWCCRGSGLDLDCGFSHLFARRRRRVGGGGGSCTAPKGVTVTAANCWMTSSAATAVDGHHHALSRYDDDSQARCPHICCLMQTQCVRVPSRTKGWIGTRIFGDV
jgi:hypothetical protein